MSSRKRRGSSSSAQRTTSSYKQVGWNEEKVLSCDCTRLEPPRGLHPVHKRQKTEKSSTGEAEKSSKAEVEKSSMCDAHSERQRVSDGDIYKQMVVDQDVVDTRRHPGGAGKSSKSDAEASSSTSYELKAHIVMKPTAAASGSATHAAVSLKKHVLSMTMLSCVRNLFSGKLSCVIIVPNVLFTFHEGYPV